MFLSLFTFEQKKIFLGFAKKILLVDDNIRDEDEEHYLRSICHEMSLGINDDVEYDLKKLDSIFLSEEERRVVVVELIALALSNTEYHSNQKEFVHNVARLLKMTEKNLEKIEELLKDFFKSQKQIVKFCTGE